MKTDGGPAFPGFQYTDGRGPYRKNSECEWETWGPGMSMRDYFAAAALQGMLAASFLSQKTDKVSWTPTIRALHAYQYADAMLSAREKGQG